MYRAGPMQAPASGGRQVSFQAGPIGPVSGHVPCRAHSPRCAPRYAIPLPEALVRKAKLRDSAGDAASVQPVGIGGHLTQGEGNA